MSGLDDTLRSLRENQRSPSQQITRGALGIKGMMDMILLKDFRNKFAIDAAEQKAAAKDRQPEMEDVELMTDDDMRIGDEYHIHVPSEPSPSSTTPPAEPPKQTSGTGTLRTMATGAALMAAGMGLAQLPAALSTQPPAAAAPSEPGTDNDTIVDFKISGGVEE